MRTTQSRHPSLPTSPLLTVVKGLPVILRGLSVEDSVCVVRRYETEQLHSLIRLKILDYKKNYPKKQEKSGKKIS